MYVHANSSFYCMFLFSNCDILFAKWKEEAKHLVYSIWFVLTQVDSKELEKSLTQRSFMTATDCVSKVLTSAQAVDGRDAFVKVISHRPY